MKLSTITQTNQKGQLVLPKKMREKLGILPSTHLHVFIYGQSLVIQPIISVSTLDDSENSYLDILQKTRGSWGSDASPKNSAIELSASQARRQAW